MPKISGLTVRQHEREGIQLPVELLVCDEHCQQVRFSPSSAAAGRHTVQARAIDISAGGMGLECRLFLPRLTEGTVRVFDPSPIGMASDGTPIRGVAFEHRVKVRRVWMCGREPMYAIGLAFVNPGIEIDAQIAALLERLRQSVAAAHSAGEGGVTRA